MVQAVAMAPSAVTTMLRPLISVQIDAIAPVAVTAVVLGTI